MVARVGPLGISSRGGSSSPPRDESTPPWTAPRRRWRAVSGRRASSRSRAARCGAPSAGRRASRSGGRGPRRRRRERPMPSTCRRCSRRPYSAEQHGVGGRAGPCPARRMGAGGARVRHARGAAADGDADARKRPHLRRSLPHAARRRGSAPPTESHNGRAAAPTAARQRRRARRGGRARSGRRGGRRRPSGGAASPRSGEAEEAELGTCPALLPRLSPRPAIGSVGAAVGLQRLRRSAPTTARSAIGTSAFIRTCATTSSTSYRHHPSAFITSSLPPAACAPDHVRDCRRLRQPAAAPASELALAGAVPRIDQPRRRHRHALRRRRGRQQQLAPSHVALLAASP